MNTKTQQIIISVDQVWAGTGTLCDGRIDDCGAQFCRDNDESMEIYEAIEAAIAAGKSRVKYATSDDISTHVATWTLS